ncbi:hypothetical protein LENED_009765 [Lentinula edodes]|uniref:Uncharacterized protein n=1 Tax=Lentinula edodes TaxID=5353 RepID=A0A1Q3EKM1_LENED|nr:hypothetical protein LENED_009765 [Lentinula edodes]
MFRNTSHLDSPQTPSNPAGCAEFADVFDEIVADSLPEHRPYDLKIDLEEGASPPLGRIYPSSEKELVTLIAHAFIWSESLKVTNGRPPFGPVTAPVKIMYTV